MSLASVATPLHMMYLKFRRGHGKYSYKYIKKLDGEPRIPDLIVSSDGHEANLIRRGKL